MKSQKTPSHRVRSFAQIAREALEKNVPEARSGPVTWGSKTNLVWVRWRRSDGLHLCLGVRRHLGWVTGEAAISVDPHELDALPLRAGGEDESACFRMRGYRVRLGELLHEEDRWWPAGDSPEDLVRTLEGIVLQMRVKADGYFLRHPPA
jgi:hypothetical protein